MPNTCYDLTGRWEYQLSKKLIAELKENNLGNEGDEEFMIIHIFLFMACTGLRKIYMINRRTGWGYFNVDKVIKGLEKNGYLIENEMILDPPQPSTPLETVISLSLMALVVSGQIQKRVEPNDPPIPT